MEQAEDRLCLSQHPFIWDTRPSVICSGAQAICMQHRVIKRSTWIREREIFSEDFVCGTKSIAVPTHLEDLPLSRARGAHHQRARRHAVLDEGFQRRKTRGLRLPSDKKRA
jgi:hypothetical protein